MCFFLGFEGGFWNNHSWGSTEIGRACRVLSLDQRSRYWNWMIQGWKQWQQRCKFLGTFNQTKALVSTCFHWSCHIFLLIFISHSFESMTLQEQEPLAREENTMRAHINNIDLVGAIHAVEARQVEIDVQQYGVFFCLKLKWVWDNFIIVYYYFIS